MTSQPWYAVESACRRTCCLTNGRNRSPCNCDVSLQANIACAYLCAFPGAGGSNEDSVDGMLACRSFSSFLLYSLVLVPCQKSIASGRVRADLPKGHDTHNFAPVKSDQSAIKGAITNLVDKHRRLSRRVALYDQFTTQQTRILDLSATANNNLETEDDISNERTSYITLDSENLNEELRARPCLVPVISAEPATLRHTQSLEAATYFRCHNPSLASKHLCLLLQ